MDIIRACALAGKPVPVIDMHCHITPFRHGAWYQAFTDTADIVRHMDALGIDCAVTAPHSFICGGDMALANAQAAQAVEAFPGRLYGYIAIVPTEGVDAVARQIKQYSQNRAFVGIKLLPGYHGSLDQPEYHYALDFAAEAQCPVLCHIWRNSPPLDEVSMHMKKRPACKFIMAHQGGGYCDQTDKAARLMADYPNLCMDVCGSFNNGYGVADIVALADENRVLYGSDLICLDPRYDFGRVALAPIADSVKKKLFADNYLRLLEGSQMGRITIPQ